MELRPEEITKIIRSQIKNYENKIEVSETGVVILVGDGIAKASGLAMAIAGKVVERELNAADQSALIDNFINELGDGV